MRIDYVNGHDVFDGCLWFVDGEYVGHDDQYDITVAVPLGHAKEVQFFHREITAGVTEKEINDIIFARDLATIEPNLIPLKLPDHH